METLTPMTRLFIALGFAGVGTKAVHFVDAERALFCYPHKRKQASGGQAQEAPDTQSWKWIDERRTLSCPMAKDDPRPPAGKVGFLQLESGGHGDEFVLSPQQGVSERFVVTAPGEQEGRLGDQVVCAKYMATAGGVGRHREDWFKSPEDALSLRRAIDALCPLSWFREPPGDSPPTRDNPSGGPAQSTSGAGGLGDGCAAGTASKRLLVYQRNRDRKIIDVPGVSLASPTLPHPCLALPTLALPTLALGAGA